MFAVYFCCLSIRLRLLFPPHISKFRGEMDSMDSKLNRPSILTADSRAPEHLSLSCDQIVAERIEVSTGSDSNPPRS